jgi:hypothetical protein
VKLLELDKNKNAFSFCKEALNLEFTEIIGNMDSSCCIGSKKRDEILVKIGEESLKEYKKIEKRKKFSINIRMRPNVLSQKEIDKLLTTVVRKGIFKILCKFKHILDFKKTYWWELVICFRNKTYKTGIFKDKKIDAQYCDLDIDDIVNAGKLSQEDIDELLTPIDDDKE